MNHGEIFKLWLKLHDNSEYRYIMLKPDILGSWERSFGSGIDPAISQPHVVSQTELNGAVEKSEYLLQTSLPVMQGLVEFVDGTGFCVGLADPDLCVLKLLGDDLTTLRARENGIGEGTVWTEQLAGTNSAGLAMVLGRPISVKGYESFTKRGLIASASSAPITENGDILGILSMVGPYHRGNFHTLGMVVSAVNHIKSKLVLQKVNHYNHSIIESMTDAVMVVDKDGVITYLNENCIKIMEKERDLLVGTRIYDVLANYQENQHFIGLITQCRSMTTDTITLFIGHERKKYNITCTPLNDGNSPYGGTVTVIRNSQHVGKLVRSWIGNNARMTFEDIVTNSKEFTQVLKNAKASSASTSNVLLLGESGTGKDIIAQAMHNYGSRRNHPFVAINCAALPRELVSSELFGYEEGAFTGAKKGGGTGKFELADQGTIFLDEIGDMPLDLQASLLRVLEERAITRLGGDKTVPVDVRVIAATNKNIDEEIANNRFRKDLYYRLGVIRLAIPPLRERRDDILPLADYLLENICKRFNKPSHKLSSEVKDAFLNYDWPGNVREMQNILEGSVQYADSSIIPYELVKDYLAPSLQRIPLIRGEEIPLEMLERQVVQEYLKKYENNRANTAKALGISRKTLYRWLKQYELENKAGE